MGTVNPGLYSCADPNDPASDPLTASCIVSNHVLLIFKIGLVPVPALAAGN